VEERNLLIRGQPYGVSSGTDYLPDGYSRSTYQKGHAAAVDHRNRGRGELARHERQEGAGWGDPLTGQPAEPYSRPEGSYRTPSRRLARDRGAPEPTDTYTPSWALTTEESGPEPTAPSTSGEYWRAFGSWRADAWPDDADAPASESGRHHRTESAPGNGIAGSTSKTAYGWGAETPGSRRRVRTADGWRDSDATPDEDVALGVDGWRPSVRTGNDPGPASGGLDRYAERTAPAGGGRHAEDALDRWRRVDRAGDGETEDGYLDDRPRTVRRHRGSGSATESTAGDRDDEGGFPAPSRADTSAGDDRAAVDRSTTRGGSTRLAVRWMRSPDEIDPVDRSRRLAGGVDATASRRRHRAPDAEPIRRHRDDASGGRHSDPDPMGRAGVDRGGRGRHAYSDSGRGDAGDRYADAGLVPRHGAHRDWSADTIPWDRFSDTHTGILERVTDDDEPRGGRHARDRASDAEGSGSGGIRSADTGWSGGGTRTGSTVGARRTGRWERDGESDRWDGFTDTGQWDRLTDTTEWRPGELFGSARDAGSSSARHGRDGASRDAGTRPGRHSADPDVLGSDEDGGGIFWSGTRLAEDDPRWVGIPESAPKSPPVNYSTSVGTASRRSRGTASRRSAEPPRLPRQRSTSASRRRDRTTTTTGRATRSATSRAGDPPRRFASEAARRRAAPLSRRLEDDLLDPRPSSPLTAALYAAAWYAVPVLALLVWVLTLDAGVPVSCIPELAGPCESERGRAMSALLDALPQFGVALATSLVLAVLLRWVNRSWGMVSIGLAAAVVGGGLSTVLLSAISGEPLG